MLGQSSVTSTSSSRLDAGADEVGDGEDVDGDEDVGVDVCDVVDELASVCGNDDDEA
jgi:hypothetical protein